MPNEISRTNPAVPNFSRVNSSNLGTMRPPVAIAINSISGPPTYKQNLVSIDSV